MKKRVFINKKTGQNRPRFSKADWEGIDGFPRIVCICGSGRFLSTMKLVEEELTLKGEIVLMIGVNTKDVARTESLEQYKAMLDELHLRKIDLADYVYVVNENGYIGESTANEIRYAKKTGKPILYHCDLKRI